MTCSLSSQSVPQYHSTFCSSSNGYQGIFWGAKRHAVRSSHTQVREASKIRKNNCATLVLQVQISKHILYLCSKEYSQRRKNYTRQRSPCLNFKKTNINACRSEKQINQFNLLQIIQQYTIFLLFYIINCHTKFHSCKTFPLRMLEMALPTVQLYEEVLK
jgi:hypothetical protein